jgi:hypothetical protein
MTKFQHGVPSVWQQYRPKILGDTKFRKPFFYLSEEKEYVFFQQDGAAITLKDKNSMATLRKLLGTD